MFNYIPDVQLSMCTFVSVSDKPVLVSVQDVLSAYCVPVICLLPYDGLITGADTK